MRSRTSQNRSLRKRNRNFSKKNKKLNKNRKTRRRKNKSKRRTQGGGGLPPLSESSQRARKFAVDVERSQGDRMRAKYWREKTERWIKRLREDHNLTPYEAESAIEGVANEGSEEHQWKKVFENAKKCCSATMDSVKIIEQKKNIQATLKEIESLIDNEKLKKIPGLFDSLFESLQHFKEEDLMHNPTKNKIQKNFDPNTKNYPKNPNENYPNTENYPEILYSEKDRYNEKDRYSEKTEPETLTEVEARYKKVKMLLKIIENLLTIPKPPKPDDYYLIKKSTAE